MAPSEGKPNALGVAMLVAAWELVSILVFIAVGLPFWLAAVVTVGLPILVLSLAWAWSFIPNHG